jgi:hypothetical protein
LPAGANIQANICLILRKKRVSATAEIYFYVNLH